VLKNETCGAVWILEVGESEEVANMILFLSKNENLCFFSGVWMVVEKCNWKSVISFSVFDW